MLNIRIKSWLWAASIKYLNLHWSQTSYWLYEFVDTDEYLVAMALKHQYVLPDCEGIANQFLPLAD